MTRLEKLIERIKARPTDASLSDVERLLQAFGWGKVRQKGSHVAFTKQGSGTITIALVSGRRVDRPYLDNILRRLELDDE